MNHPFKITHFLLVFLLSFLSIGFLQGQIEFPSIPKTEKDSSKVKKLVAIPLNQIPAKIEEAEQAIKIGEKKILPKKEIVLIDSLFPLYVEFIKEQKKVVNDFTIANPNKSKIENLINKWDGYYGQLNSWQNTVNDIEDKNMDVSIPFNERKNVWTLTLDDIQNNNAPPSLINNVNRTLESITAITLAITEENNKLLTLETAIISQKAIINQTIEELSYLKNSEVYNIFKKRHEALWKSSFAISKVSKVEQQALETLPGNFNSIRNYFKENINDLYNYLFWVIIISLLILYFKKTFISIKFTDPVPLLQRSKDIIVNHTISSIIFIIALFSIFFFKNIPFLLNNIFGIISVMAVIPILKTVLYNRFNNSLYFILAFYIINSIKTYIWFSPTYYRIYILIEAVFILITIYHFIHPYFETRKMKVKTFGRFLFNAVPFFYLLVLISIISNVFGYTNLTDISLKIVIQSTVLTVIFYGLLMIASGIFLGFLHIYFINQEDFNPERKILIEKRTIQLIRTIIFFWWFFYFLEMIEVRASLFEWISEKLTETYDIGLISFNLNEVLVFLLVLFISFILSNFISMVVDGGALDFLKLPKGIPAAISMVLRYIIIAFGFILALAALGVDLSQFNLMAGALGLGIGFGLQTIISNFVSGLILVFERPILPGDTVELQNLLGKVTDIGVRSSKVRTFEGAEVIVPNNNLISNDLINWTLSDNVRRIEIKIGAAYGSDPNIVLKLLKEEAYKNEFTLPEPEPLALFEKFGDSSLDFRLLVWVPYENGLASKSNISIGIYNSFKENGIQIPFPQQDVYIKESSKKELT